MVNIKQKQATARKMSATKRGASVRWILN